MAYLPGQHDAATPSPTETLPIPGSAFLQAATYDPKNMTLTLDFKNGTQAIHQFFYPMAWAQFKESNSHGSFYARSIKGKYRAINFRSSLRVSDLTRAMRENRNAAVLHKARAR